MIWTTTLKRRPGGRVCFLAIGLFASMNILKIKIRLLLLLNDKGSFHSFQNTYIASTFDRRNIVPSHEHNFKTSTL